VPRPGPRRRRVRHRRRNLGHHHLALAEFGRDQALPTPVLDLPPRRRLRAQGGPGARPLRSPIRRQAAAARRVRHLRRREDLHPSPHPQTRHHIPGTEPAGARRGGVLPRRLPGLPGRLGRAPRQGIRPLRSHHWHRPVQPADRPSHDLRALRVRASGVLGGRQRLLPSRSGQHRPAPASLAPLCA
jgi:hypothetical protein